MLHFETSLCGQHRDSIQAISLNSSWTFNEELKQMQVVPLDFVFFDEQVQTIYYQLSLFRPSIKDTLPFVFIEIKKTSNMQFKLKPLFTQKISLSAFKQNLYIDSLQLDKHPLASGNYDFIVYLMNDSSKVLHSLKQKFQVFNPEKKQAKDEFIEDITGSEIVDINKTFVGKYDIVQLQKNINALKPLAQGAEIKVIKQISSLEDLTFLRQFMYNFWYNRFPANPEQGWKEYADKLNLVASRYGTATEPGYLTDRGRIYLVYGAPDKEEKVHNEKNAAPYEIWFYYNANQMSNVKFLFFQPGIIGSQMVLLHSNVESEIINPYWTDQLFSDPADVHNKLTHRAFEYFK